MSERFTGRPGNGRLCFWSGSRRSRASCWPLAKLGRGGSLAHVCQARSKGAGGAGIGPLLPRERPTPRAIRAVSLIKAESPHEAEALTIKGLALASLEETGPARQVLEQAWQMRPSGDVARVLAAIYLSSNENERGLQMLIEASRLDPSDFRPWYAMGESVYLRLRRHDLAIEAFRESLKRSAEPYRIPHWTCRCARQISSHRGGCLLGRASPPGATGRPEGARPGCGVSP